MKKGILFFATVLIFSFSTFNCIAQAPNWLWAKSAEGISSDFADAVAIDASGNIYVGGSFESQTITFGSYTLTNSNLDGANLFLVKYNVNGDVLWAKKAEGTVCENCDIELSSIALDESGNIYITGYYENTTMTFGSYTLTNSGNSDCFLVKYDLNGNVLWAKNIGGTSWDYSSSIALDESGNIYVGGDFDSQSITFDSYTLINAGDKDFLAKYDANGNVIWAKNPESTSGYSIAVDASGNIYIVGEFDRSTVTFGSYTLTNSGGGDIFLVKYDSNGNVIWAKSAGGTSSDYGYAVAIDASGNIYVGGSFDSQSITFDSYTLINAGDKDIFLAKYDVNGNVIWVKNEGGTDWDFLNSVAVDASGNIYVGGSFDSPTITFGSYTLTKVGSHIESNDIFLFKYNSDGNVLWAKSVGGTDYEAINSIEVNSSGNVYIAGFFDSPTITFGASTLTNAGGWDIFLAKLSNETGIDEINSLLNIKIYPNPANTTINIDIKNKNLKIFNINIYNLHGEIVFTKESNKIVNKNLKLNVSSLTSGLYFLNIQTQSGLLTKKFVITQ